MKTLLIALLVFGWLFTNSGGQQQSCYTYPNGTQTCN